VTSIFRERQAVVAAGIVLVGLVAATIIYGTAGSAANRAGERPEDSKQYLRQMEVYGGTANVLASQVRELFAGLWRGRTLAFTVASLSVILAAAAFIALTPLPSRTESSGGPESGDARRKA
jgi:hypothetical protein